MIRALYVSLFLISGYSLACRREPSPYHSRIGKLSGDNGFQLKINENPEKYEPGRIYTSKYILFQITNQSVYK